MKSYIENLNQLATKVGHFDEAEDAQLFYGNAQHPQPVEDFKAVFNMTQQKIATVVSNDYRIIQHNDVASAVVESLGRLNIDVFGTVNQNDNRMQLDLVFSNRGTPIKDDATGVQIGIRVVNSYNKTTSFRLEMFGYRHICKNGMAFGKLMGMREVTIHHGEKKPLERIQVITERFIHVVIAQSTALQQYVDQCIGDSAEWELVDKLSTVLFVREKHRKEIMSRLEKDKTTTRWALYNAVTNYISHGEHLKATVVDMLEKTSQKLLSTPFELLEQQLIVEQ